MRKRLTILIIEHAVLIALAVLALTSCVSQRTVTVERIQHDTVAENHYLHDSIYIAVERERRNDTVWLTRYEYRYRNLHDSIYITHRDSIPYPVEVVREVRRRNAYDRFTARGFWILIATILVVLTIWLGSKTPYGKMVMTSIKIAMKL